LKANSFLLRSLFVWNVAGVSANCCLKARLFRYNRKSVIDELATNEITFSCHFRSFCLSRYNGKFPNSCSASGRQRDQGDRWRQGRGVEIRTGRVHSMPINLSIGSKIHSNFTPK
jgi:hypothetical protein